MFWYILFCINIIGGKISNFIRGIHQSIYIAEMWKTKDIRDSKEWEILYKNKYVGVILDLKILHRDKFMGLGALASFLTRAVYICIPLTLIFIGGLVFSFIAGINKEESIATLLTLFPAMILVVRISLDVYKSQKNIHEKMNVVKEDKIKGLSVLIDEEFEKIGDTQEEQLQIDVDKLSSLVYLREETEKINDRPLRMRIFNSIKGVILTSLGGLVGLIIDWIKQLIN